MKKTVFTTGLMLIIASSLMTYCTKEQYFIEESESSQSPKTFSLVAKAVETRTVTEDGAKITWVADDALAVFHSLAGENNYGSNDKFTITADNLETETFTGELQEDLQEGKSYDWAVIYPYNSYYTTPFNTTTYTNIGIETKTISNYGDMSYLAGDICPLVGIVKNVSADQSPSINLSNVASVAKIIVTNNTAEALTITSVSLTAPKPIVGSFYVNFADPENLVVTPREGHANNTSTLSVKGGSAIPTKGTATFYIPISPLSLATGDELSITVNTFSKTSKMTKAVDFSSSKIVTLNFDYNKSFTSEDYYPATSIAAGDKVIFASGTEGNVSVMGHYTAGNNVPAVAGTVESSKIASSSSMGIYIVSGNSTDGFTFFDQETNKYLNATNTTSSNSLQAISELDAYAYWDVSFSNNAVVTNKGKSSRNIIRFNSNNSLFNCYSSGQADVYIFKYDSRSPVSLSFENTNLEFTTDNYSTFTGQTVTASPTISGITYSIEGDEIGTIEASSGAVELNGKEGTATITASFNGNDTYAPSSASYSIVVKGKNITITANSTNLPISYGVANTFTEYTLEGYKFNIQQICKNGSKIQMRASGNSNGTGTIYNTSTFPGKIAAIVLTYDSSDTKKNCTIKIGSSKNPQEGTTINPNSDGLVYTFDCSSYSFDYFVLENGENAGYLSSIKIIWK